MEHMKTKQVEKYHKASEGEKAAIECNPYKIFHQALENCKPMVAVVRLEKGGKIYLVSNEQLKSSSVTLQDK